MGKRKIIVSERDNIAALFEDDKAIEFIINRGDMLLGDVYLASVENILPSIDAAFVNVGGDKMGFLHSSDVPGKGDLKNRLQPKQTLVVQVMKEPTGHKGPRVTTNISLPGRFLVLMPESRGISISRKIESPQERSRLKSVVSLIKPPGMGIIIRTEADQQKESDIQEDFETLLERWQNIVTMADSSTPPTLLYRDQDLLYRVIREAVTDDVKELFVDTNFGLQRAQQLLQNWNMDKALKVNLYSGNQSILVAMGVDKEIKLALQTKVPLPSGGYLYIQPTEALTVVDVNSGKFTSLQSQSETIKLTNLEACKEIARQLRLRNIGGMIVVDFIDMESRADKLKILEAFEVELAPDKAKPQIGQLSDLGLVEMTRHRQGQALSEMFTKKCMSCNGTGHGIEEFNWAPPMLDGDPRTMGRPGSSRSKLPLRNMRWQQNQQAKQPAQPMSATISLKKLMDPAKPEPALQETKPTILQQMHASKAKPTLPEDKVLGDYLKDKTAQTLGARFANFVKLAHTPPGINSIMVKINPKANDILTLIDTIEGSSVLPLGMDDDDLDMGDSDGGEGYGSEGLDGFDEGDEESPNPANGQSRPSHEGRSAHGAEVRQGPQQRGPRDNRDRYGNRGNSEYRQGGDRRHHRGGGNGEAVAQMNPQDEGYETVTARFDEEGFDDERSSKPNLREPLTKGRGPVPLPFGDDAGLAPDPDARSGTPRGRQAVLPSATLPGIDIEITDPIEDIEEGAVPTRRIRDAEIVVTEEVLEEGSEALLEVDDIEAEEAEVPRPRRGRPPALRRPVEPRPELDEETLDQEEAQSLMSLPISPLMIDEDDADSDDDETGDEDGGMPTPNASAAALAKRRRGRPPKRSNKPIRPNPSIQPVLDEAPPAKRGRKPAAEEDED